METLQLEKTDLTSEQNKEEDIMNTATTLTKQESISQSKTAGQRREFGLLFDVVSTVLVVLAGLAVYKATGLYDGVASTAGKIGLGAVISYVYLVVFRRAAYLR